MEIGYLTVRTVTADEALPVAGAHIIISQPDGDPIYETYSDANGNTDYFALTAPDASLTLDPDYREAAYSVCDVSVSCPGFVTEHIHGVEIVDTQRSILTVHMLPLTSNPYMTEDHIYIPPPALLYSGEYLKETEPEPIVLAGVIIPDYITVHLGAPTNAAARNVRVSFPEYIKNVVSSEIYPTWPENSLIANTHAIVTFALNRVFTEMR